MRRKKQFANPFYVLLVLSGVAFALTACAYGVMTIVSLRAAESPDTIATGNSPLVAFMDRHGGTLLAIELVALAVCTVMAIGTDRFWLAPTQSPPESGAGRNPASPRSRQLRP